MSPEQKVLQFYPLRNNADSFTYPGSALCFLQRAAFLSGVSWQRENGWQPIETAPKDEDILVCNCNGSFRVKWNGEVWQLYNCHGLQDYVVDALGWQPLPPPPASIINK